MKAIAIIGVGCRFPGANDGEALWAIARNGTRTIADIPPDRWRVDDFFSPEPGTPGKMSSRVGGFIEGVDRFDAGFFGVSPREAAQMDPQQRLLLEVCWETFEHAGLSPSDVAGRAVGAFIGVQRNDYGRLIADPARNTAYTVAGNQFSMTVSRLSNIYDLRGPCLALDAGCASVFAAVHLGCASLETGESDLALAGGVHLNLAPHDSIAASQSWMLSPRGRCRSFDAEADGHVRSEGCGILALKRLDEAERDGDAIHAVIRGTAFLQEGRPGGFTSPWGPEVERTLRSALARGGVLPSSIGYVEAHGVGSPVADATEYEALARVLVEDAARRAPCYLGSIKPNIGHAETASAAASLIKTMYVLRRGEVPPLVDFETINPDIDEQSRTLGIARSLTPFPALRPRRAAVNAFGYGGMNASVILEEAPAIGSQPAPTGAQALCLSARTPTALHALARRYRAFLAERGDLSVADVCAASMRRAHLQHRAVFLGTTMPGLLAGLDSLTGSLTGAGAPPAATPDAWTLVRGESSAQQPRVILYFRNAPWPRRTVSELLDACAPFRDAHAQMRHGADEGEPARSDRTRNDPIREDFIRDDLAGDDLTGDDLIRDEDAFAIAAARMWRALGVAVSGVAADVATREAAAVFAGAGSRRRILRARRHGAPDRLDPLAIPVFLAESGDGLTLAALVSSEMNRTAAAAASPTASAVCDLLAHHGDLLVDLPGGAVYDARRGAALVEPGEGFAGLLRACAERWVRGCELDFRRLAARRVRHVPLPTYPFERERCWIDERGPGSGEPPDFDTAGSTLAAMTSTVTTEAVTTEAVTAQAWGEGDDATQQRAIVGLLRHGVAAVLGRAEREVPVDVPLRDQGLDSVDLLRLMERARRATGVEMDPARFMDQPCIDEIASRIVFGTGDDLRGVDLSAEGNLEPSIDATGPAAADPPRSILLTGATGFVGAFLLHELLEQTDATIYCLVRAVDSLDGEHRLTQNLSQYGLPTTALADRVRVVIGDFDRPLLGLSYERFDLLGARLDAIYHAAASVNWAYPYRALQRVNVGGTEDVVRLAAHIKRKPIHHVSTLGVFPLGHPELGILHEDDGLVVPETSEDLGTGYNQSKWVAEKLLYTAGSRRGLAVSLYRPGFVTGRGDTGATQMGRHDFVAAFLKGCIQMGAAPDWHVALDLMPVDYLARAVVRLSRNAAAPGRPVAWHLLNPDPLGYEAVYALLRDCGYAIETVAYAAWRDRVLALAREPGDHALFPFWPYYAALTVERARQLEAHMGDRVPLDDRHAREALQETDIRCAPVRRLVPVYVDFFRRAGYFPPATIQSA